MKRDIRTVLIGLMIMQTSVTTFASDGWKLSKDKLIANSDFMEKSIEDFEDDILSDDDIKSIKLSTEDVRAAKIWNISTMDMQRYKLLMSGKSGVYYKNKELSPVEVLGINARDNFERNHFAKLLVKNNNQRFAKELAFEKAYNTTYKSYVINTNQKIIGEFNTDKYSPLNYKPVDLRDNDTLMMFVTENEPVKRITSPLLSEIYANSKVKLNIYLMDKSIDKDRVYSWAKKHNIAPDLVASKRVTLNIGYQGFDDKTPTLYLVRDGKTTDVDLTRF